MLDSDRPKATEPTLPEPVIILDTLRFGWPGQPRPLMAILRAMGARPGHVFGLILGEAITITIAGIGLGMLLVYALFMLGRDWIAQAFGLFIELNLLAPGTVYVIVAGALLGCLIGLILGIRMYRYSLADGMTVRL